LRRLGVGSPRGSAEAVARRTLKRESDLDLYTKAVLTVIAIALSVIAFRAAGLTAVAQQGGLVRVQICGREANPRAGNPLTCASILTDGRGVGHLVSSSY
jgi:hypothetical protein